MLRFTLLTAAALAVSFSSVARAQDTLVLEAEIPAGSPRYLEVPFTVPDGIVEIEVRHDDLSEANILDWGLRDPERFRGWGGGNPEPAVVGVDAATRSYLPGPITAGEWAVLVGQARVEEAPARYRIEIDLRVSPTLGPHPARAPYTPAAPLVSGPGWYAGDFHVHSRHSGDATATLDEIATLARSRGLDFVEVSEHNTVSHLEFLVDVQARYPEVLLLPGIEITTYDGHANALGATEWVDFRVGPERTGQQIADDVAALGVPLSLEHPVLDLGADCIGCAWELEVDPASVAAIELQNGAYSVTGTLFYRQAVAFWERLLDSGARVAPLGGSDDHRAGMGDGSFDSPIGSPTTMVYAEELSAAAIAAAVAAGRTVVKLEGPEDPMVELRAGEAMIGDTVSERVLTLEATVQGGTGTTLAFVRNGERAHSVEVDADPFTAELEVAAPPGDVEDRWRLELREGSQPRVVTGHIWIEATGEPAMPDAGAGASPDGDGGCACRASPGSASAPAVGTVVAFLLFAGRRRRRRMER